MTNYVANFIKSITINYFKYMLRKSRTKKRSIPSQYAKLRHCKTYKVLKKQLEFLTVTTGYADKFKQAQFVN